MEASLFYHNTLMKNLISLLFLLCCCYLAIAQPSAPHYFHIEKGQLPQFLKHDGTTFPLISAHRGGRNLAGYPENAVETFEHVLQYTHAIIECDIVQSKDSVLYLMHDRSLDRTTTGSGKVTSQNWAAVKNLYLIDDFGDTTDFHPPRLDEVLKWTKGKAILALDVKRGVPFERVVEQIQAHQVEDYTHIIVYNLDDAQKVYQLDPSLMMSVSIRNDNEWQAFRQSGIPPENVVAFTGTIRSDAALYKSLHDAGILCIQGTMGNIDRQAQARGEEVYQALIKQGIDILATDRPIEAAKAVSSMISQDVERMKFLKK
jgi:glycerophosphoryl diester phosphodiesterase